jgi:hypothetical protein
MKTRDKRSTRKSSCCSRGGVSTRSFERTATRHPAQAVIFTFAISLDKAVGIFLKHFKKTRRHEGIVPLVAHE